VPRPSADRCAPSALRKQHAAQPESAASPERHWAERTVQRAAGRPIVAAALVKARQAPGRGTSGDRRCQRSLLSAWYRSVTLAGIRPRSLTAIPWALAQARISPER
jgi:hypothetical protein